VNSQCGSLAAPILVLKTEALVNSTYSGKLMSPAILIDGGGEE